MIPWSSTYAACEERIKTAKRSSLVRTFFALTIPFYALAVQLAIWPIVQPFFWFVFYPAVFLSAWLGGFTSGLVSTSFSVVLCWYFFIPPERSFEKLETKYFVTSTAFFVMGLIISSLVGRLRKIVKVQKQYEAELLRRESQLREAQRIGNFGSWAWKIKINHIDWSEETYRIFGLQPQQFSDTIEAFLDCVHPRDRDVVEKCIKKALSKEMVYSIDHRIVLPDGTVKVVHEVADIYFNGAGEPIEMIGTVHDITERKKTEEAYKESEKKYRGLIETASDPIVIVDSKGSIEFANRQIRTTLGYEPTELLGKPVEVLIPERFKENHVGYRTEYIRHPTSRIMGRNLQLVARKKDGGEIPVDISLSPFNTKKGTIVTAIMRDMSERKRQEAQQRFLFDTSRMLSETTNYTERIQRIADLVVPPLADCCLIHIFENDQLILKAFSQRDSLDLGLVKEMFEDGCFFSRDDFGFGPNFVAKQNDAQLVESIDEIILRQVAFEDEDLFQKFNELNIQSWISVPMLARGRNIGVISMARCKPMEYSSQDLNLANLVADRAAIAVDNAKLYKDAQDAVKLREDVLAIVSHDLKNPLSLIRGFNEIIADKIKDNLLGVGDFKSTEAIARAVRQMERLISDLLDFAKIESGTLSIDPKPHRVDRLIWEGIESVYYHLEKKAIQVKTEIQPGIVEVSCDMDRIRQVFSNLLGNAVKFSPEQQQIVIRAEQNKSEIIFSVSDRGPGVSQENLEHLFERYWQPKECAKQGTGLGLAIAKGIIEGHRGQIWAESSVGQGTTFFFTLPVYDSRTISKVKYGNSEYEATPGDDVN